MTESEFNTEMQRLTESFPRGSFPTERIKLIWREVRQFDAPWFAQVVSGFIGGMRTAPMVPDFSQAAGAKREKDWGSQKVIPMREWVNTHPRCSACKDQGSVLARRETEHQWVIAFKCSCSAGQLRREAWAAWHQGRHSEGYRAL